MAEEVSLLDFWPSPFGMRVRIALDLKGIEYEYKEQSLLEEKSPLLVKSNPVYKKVPVLIHKGRPICESLIILQYIDAVWKNKFPLMPTDPYHQSQARFWAEFVENKLYDCGKMIWMNKGEEQEKANWFYAYEKCGNFSVEEECPRLVQWAKKCIEIDSVVKSLVDEEKIYKFVLEVKKMMGLE
ncbi:hypothetical protein REPUB_Repub13aG0213300 [Reevesia pubescens]